MDDQAAELRRLMRRAAHPRAIDASPPPRLVAVFGARLGVGATSIAVNLSIAAVQQGWRTLLIDGDLKHPEVTARCGAAASSGLAEVLSAQRDIHETLIRGPLGLQILPGVRTAAAGWPLHVASGSALPSASIAPTRSFQPAASSQSLPLVKTTADLPDASPPRDGAALHPNDPRRVVNAEQNILRQVRSLGLFTDLVVVDVGHEIEPPISGLVSACDVLLIVTSPETEVVLTCYAAMKSPGLASILPRARLLVNRADENDGRVTHHRLDQSTRNFLGVSVPLAGSIPCDARLDQLDRRGLPLVLAEPDSPTSKKLQTLAHALATHLSTDPSSHDLLPERKEHVA